MMLLELEDLVGGGNICWGLHKPRKEIPEITPLGDKRIWKMLPWDSDRCELF